VDRIRKNQREFIINAVCSFVRLTGQSDISFSAEQISRTVTFINKHDCCRDKCGMKRAARLKSRWKLICRSPQQSNRSEIDTRARARSLARPLAMRASDRWAAMRRTECRWK
jgi:hypothetical protein